MLKWGDIGKRRTRTIDKLPDELLVDIFDSCIVSEIDDQPWKWVQLAHVCRQWRQIIFASPCRLHLQLGCTNNLRTPVRKYLDVWPAFPIFIDYKLADIPEDNLKYNNDDNVMSALFRLEDISQGGRNIDDNVMAALENPDRVCGLYLDLTASQLAMLAPVLSEPFPGLKKLRLRSCVWHWAETILPSEFLGGSAPNLQELDFSYIPFPDLPTLLLSACELVTLQLHGITQAGYIPPEVMAACLIALPKLETFSIAFNRKVSERVSDLDQTHISPISRSVLPALTSFTFIGYSNYLEDLVTPIDSPQLNHISITYFYCAHIDWAVSRLFNFINRSQDPQLTLCGWAAVGAERSDGGGFLLNLCHGRDYAPTVRISTSSEEWRVSHLIWLLGQFSARLSDVRHLSIFWSVPQELDHAEWVQLLRPFYNVQTLYGYEDRIGEVALALEDDAEGEVDAKLFPALILLCWDDPSMQVISVPKFEAAHRRSGHPITNVEDPSDFFDVVQSYY